LADNSEADIERIASRLALVVSEDGEAANAGRAIGQLARRLGMTGGDLKQIFMAGAVATDHSARLSQSVGTAERLEREVIALRTSLRLVESNARVLERERDALHYEIATLRTALDHRRSGARLGRVLGVTVLVALIVAGAVGYFRPIRLALDTPSAVTAEQNAPPSVGSQGTGRVGVVHAQHAAVFAQPDRAAPVLATLRAGMPVVIHRLLWNMLVQWAEIDVGSSTGYVLTTDIDLS
jgi:hypothetical protein